MLVLLFDQLFKVPCPAFPLALVLVRRLLVPALFEWLAQCHLHVVIPVQPMNMHVSVTARIGVYSAYLNRSLECLNLKAIILV